MNILSKINIALLCTLPLAGCMVEVGEEATFEGEEASFEGEEDLGYAPELSINKTDPDPTPWLDQGDLRLRFDPDPTPWKNFFQGGGAAGGDDSFHEDPNDGNGAAGGTQDGIPVIDPDPTPWRDKRNGRATDDPNDPDGNKEVEQQKSEGNSGSVSCG